MPASKQGDPGGGHAGGSGKKKPVKKATKKR